jgi:hypothetical protein
MMVWRVVVLGAISSLGLASCISGRAPSSVLSQWTMQAPAGWKPLTMPHLLGLSLPLEMRSYQSPRGNQTVALWAMSHADIQPNAIGPFERVVSRTRLCGGREATVLQKNVPFSRYKSDLVEMQWHRMRATASYTYPKSSEPDSTAEAAIRTVCPI